MSSTRLTSSDTGTLYFGYGSNLSPFQMVRRCPSSGVPIAIAKLNSWSWLITERGTANVIPVKPAETSLDTDATTVWGVLYNLVPDDERALDRCEGFQKGAQNLVVTQQAWKPFEQGGVYNKMYLPVKIVRWLVADPKTILGLSETEFKGSILRSLVYVDERSTRPGRITLPYIRRMGRSARECVKLGVPEKWINNVFSQHGIDKDDPNSFTDDIKPGSDAREIPESDWETMRQKFLRDEVEEQPTMISETS